MDEPREEWRDIKEWEGYYQVSSYGRIYSLKSSQIISLRPHSKGYLTVSLWRTINGEKYREQKYIHRMVADAFIDNPNQYPCVNHIDNNRANNHVENLEWCTHKQNTAHAKNQNRLKTPWDMGYRKQKQPYRVCMTDGTHIGDYKSMADAMIAIGENPENHAPINNMRYGKPYKGKYIFSKLPRIKNQII